MTLTGSVDGNNVQWLDKVSDARYGQQIGRHSPTYEENTDGKGNKR